ncbi:Uncharacterised protein [Mycobacteroides abscessus subsp. abscessus]|nr:Uncharacterised protein [Mycobacteroides abscessus subsp. abscessus]
MTVIPVSLAAITSASARMPLASNNLRASSFLVKSSVNTKAKTTIPMVMPIPLYNIQLVAGSSIT